MANPKHVEKLKEGVDAWNDWRQAENTQAADESKISRGGGAIKPNLSMANLNELDLSRADLMDANLKGATLDGAKMQRVILRNANLDGASLREADLSKADLGDATLRRTNLQGANLSAHLRETTLGQTIFLNTDLSGAEKKHLKTCRHDAPSMIDYRTLQRSGKLPSVFLRGCGLSDWEIEAAKLYQPELTHQQITDIVYRIDAIRAESPIQIHNLFISYSHVDSCFIEHLEDHLKKRHIRYWRDVHDATAGPLEKIVVRAMRQNPTVLLVLSKRSVESDWVEFEAEQARKMEKELDRHILCPIALDDHWKTCKWSGVLRNQIKKYKVLDFSRWQDTSIFKGTFKRLISGLDLFYN